MSSDARGTLYNSHGGGSHELELRLRLERGDTVRGSVCLATGTEVVEFHSWIDLMAAIDRLGVTGYGALSDSR